MWLMCVTGFDRILAQQTGSGTLETSASRGNVRPTVTRSVVIYRPLADVIVICVVQERLTKQIAVAITEAINPAGVGVVIEAT